MINICCYQIANPVLLGKCRCAWKGWEGHRHGGYSVAKVVGQVVLERNKTSRVKGWDQRPIASSSQRAIAAPASTCFLEWMWGTDKRVLNNILLKPGGCSVEEEAGSRVEFSGQWQALAAPTVECRSRYLLLPVSHSWLCSPAPSTTPSNLLRHSFVGGPDRRIVIVNKVVRWGRCFGKKSFYFLWNDCKQLCRGATCCHLLIIGEHCDPLYSSTGGLLNQADHGAPSEVIISDQSDGFSTRLTMGWPVKRDNTHPIVIISDQSDGFQTSFSYLLSQL